MNISKNFIIQDVPARVAEYVTRTREFNTFIDASLARCGKYEYDKDNYFVINALISYFTKNEKFESLTNKQALSLKKGILIIGNTGSGKTELMQIFQGLVRNLESAYYFHQSMSFVHSECQNQRFRNICIDDLGKEDFVSDYGVKRDVMSEIFYHRYENFKINGMITHFTTQLSEAQIKEKYGNHIWGRIKEMCNVFVLGGGEDYKERRLSTSRTPFIPKSICDKDFPLFFPKYITQARKEHLKALAEMQQMYAESKAKAEQIRQLEAQMSEQDKQKNRVAEKMSGFGFTVQQALERGKTI